MSRIAELFQSMSYGPAPEAADAARAWLADHGGRFGLFIDNAWVEPSGGAYLTTYNPATGDKLAEFADGAPADVDAAVRAARRAFETWSATPGHVRARHLYALARAVQRHARLFAVLESLDNGKSIRETRDLDIPLVARHFYYHAGWAQLADTELREYQPVGVVGQIIPWNFPLLMLAWKIAPALAMGNTVILKPAPYTPLTALLFGEIAAEVGLPPGVVNVVTGGDETGAAITAHPDIDKIAFTGSTHVGRIIRRVTAGTGKRLSLELGGKSPFIVFDDADQDAAIEGLVDAIWFNQGQVCCAGSRLLVQENIAEKFLEKVRWRMGRLRIGDSLDKGIDMGAVVDPAQRATIDGWVQRGVAEGAALFQPDFEPPAAGCWYPPTLLTNVQPAAAVAQEEIFGPVVVSMTFRTPKEAVALANNTRYDLAASIWTENVNLALDVARKVKAGTVWVNCTNLFDAAAGFGGYRESGYGREGGEAGIYEYLRPIWEARPRPTPPTEPNVGAWSAHVPARPKPLNGGTNGTHLPLVDRTAKLYIGGKQARSDGNYSRPVLNPSGAEVGQVADGNRKDIRDAVEAAHAASGWGYRSGHQRAQTLYYIAENLAARADEFAKRLIDAAEYSPVDAAREVMAAVDRLFTFAAWCDKYGGTVAETTLRGVVMGLHEPIGVIGIACPDDAPLLAFVSLVGLAISRGNTVVAIPSERCPLLATDFYQVLDTSDVPAGVVNIVTGSRDHLTRTLAEHDNVDAIWYFGSAEGAYYVEHLSASNMKRTWTDYGAGMDWYDPRHCASAYALREATQVKHIWIPSGE
jgi:aldehyde dehydrogenase (NAD+)